MKRSVFLFVTVVAMLSVLMGCSGDDNSTGPSNENTQPPTDLAAQKIEVPNKMTQSTDPQVQTAVAYINIANGITNYVNSLVPPGGYGKFSKSLSTLDGPPWEYTWTDQDLTIKLIVDKEGDHYTWTLIYDGTDGTNNYSNWTAMEAERSQDATSGSMVIYEPVTTNTALQWDWQVDAQGVYTMTMEDMENSKIVVSRNPDNSGYVEAYTIISGSYQIAFKAEWNADGSGEWWTYSSGTVDQHGTWS